MTLISGASFDEDKEWDDLTGEEEELDDEFDSDLDPDNVRVYTPEEEADDESDLDLEAANSALIRPALAPVLQALERGDAHVSFIYAFHDLNATDLQVLAFQWPLIAQEIRSTLVGEASDLSLQDFRLDFTRFLMAASEDESPEVRQLAANGLAIGGPDAVATTLLDLLREDEAEDVRAAAASSLAYFVELSETDELDLELAEQLHSTLFAIAEDEDESWNVRRRAIEAAAGYGPGERISNMVNWLWEEDELGLRVSAIFAAGRANLISWLQTIQDLLTDEDPELRFEAARAAGMLGDVDLLPPLSEMIPREEDVDIRHQALISIGMIGGPAASRTLMRLSERAPQTDAEVIEDAMMEATIGDPDTF